ncbi:3-hydroxyacyl-CoA dehydrogenase [Verticiella sediminum]|uniref:3-hydroxyacyl-CoA dehydrogenase n=1 Tax=Verticiella sediminum TaxID=1247510 RepID=A0A556AIG7_9BURK|nr:3-hydroxyacyl-CoA dehydrogenase NAD-binding domain-containing protein [Verticiella sediminum]TSH92692.1 3-hydroxyacyl-CoA dehydrogenase [Verticiella sediminum]
MNLVNYHTKDAIAYVAMAKAPLNALDMDMIAALHEAMDRARRDSAVLGVVLFGEARMFSAGADIREFDAPDTLRPALQELCSAIECLCKPVVAAIHTCALGGALELAVGCHARIAMIGSRLGLPEVSLGLLPGGGGTQRVPRLVGTTQALQLMIGGKPIDAAQAHAIGLVDEVVTSDLLASAAAAVIRLATGASCRVTSRLPADVSSESLAEIERRRTQTARLSTPAQAAIVECVDRAMKHAPEDALAFEWRELIKLMHTPQSRALRHLFFAEKEAARLSTGAAPEALVPIRRIAVVGAGTMGSGIATCFLAAGFPVVLLDVADAALERGRDAIQRALDAGVRRGRWSCAESANFIDRLTTATDLEEAASADLVIEAVFENLSLKREVMQRLGKIVTHDAILATNTSTLNVDELAAATSRPSQVIGMHFFSPAHVMRLLEIVNGRATSPRVLATAMAIAHRIGKQAVVSGVCYGFIGNRMLEGYLRETDLLLLEGASPAQIDRALEAFGMAMGPCRMLDMSGVDVSARVVEEAQRRADVSRDGAYRLVCRRLHAMGRDGQKSGVGYYRHDGQKLLPVDDQTTLYASWAAEFGIARRSSISDDEIVHRCLLASINEGFRIIDERVASREGDIDVVWTNGYGFPRHLGGPMYQARQWGLPYVIARLEEFAKRYPREPSWAAAPLLAVQAAANETTRSTA